MTAEEYHDRLLELGLRSTEAARRLFGVDRKSAGDWGNPEFRRAGSKSSGPPETAARLLRLTCYLVEEGHMGFEEIEAILEGDDEPTD